MTPFPAVLRFALAVTIVLLAACSKGSSSRVPDGSVGATIFREDIIATGLEQVVDSGFGVTLRVNAGTMQPGAPLSLVIGDQPSTWVVDGDYEVSPFDIQLEIDPESVLSESALELVMPIGDVPLGAPDPAAPSVLSGTAALFTSAQDSLAVETIVIEPPEVLGGIRRAVARIGRAAVRAVATTARVVRNVVRAGVRFAVRVIRVAVRVVRTLLLGQSPNLTLHQYDRASHSFTSPAPISGFISRVAFCVHGLRDSPEGMLEVARVAADTEYPPLGMWDGDPTGNVYDRVYAIGYNPKASIASVGSLIRETVAGVNAFNVDFICHSMGGLVVRYATEVDTSPNWPSFYPPDRVVMLGTPNEGVPLLLLHQIQAVVPNVLERQLYPALFDLASGSSVLVALQQSNQPNLLLRPRRYFTLAGNRWDNFNGLGAFVTMQYFGLLDHDGIVPVSSCVAASMQQKAQFYAGRTTALHFNHSELKADRAFLLENLTPLLQQR